MEESMRIRLLGRKKLVCKEVLWNSPFVSSPLRIRTLTVAQAYIFDQIRKLSQTLLLLALVGCHKDAFVATGDHRWLAKHLGHVIVSKLLSLFVSE